MVSARITLELSITRGPSRNALDPRIVSMVNAIARLTKIPRTAKLNGSVAVMS